MASNKAEQYEQDPEDGLRRAVVGPWVRLKHEVLRRYLSTSSAARRRWPGPSAFIDLYCGPGRCRIRRSQEVLPGSSLAAAIEAQKRERFREFHIADVDAANLSACRQRLVVAGFENVTTYHGAAEVVAAEVVRRVSKRALHLAFLDPFNLDAMPFEVIRTLSCLPHCDLLMHFSVMDYRRNLELMRRNPEDGRLDRMAPGWRKVTSPSLGVDALRRAVWDHWQQLIRNLGYCCIGRAKSVRGDRNAELYWLVLAARHPVADKFWNVATGNSPQGDLFRGGLR